MWVTPPITTVRTTVSSATLGTGLFLTACGFVDVHRKGQNALIVLTESLQCRSIDHPIGAGRIKQIDVPDAVGP